MEEMIFPPHSFELIWSEGAIANIGFERGLHEWRDFLVPGGYQVVHDVSKDLQRKTELTCICGFTGLGQFELSQEIWWKEYYEPLEKQLEKYRGMASWSERIKHEMKAAEQEIEAFEYDDSRFASVFFVLKKQNQDAPKNGHKMVTITKGLTWIYPIAFNLYGVSGILLYLWHNNDERSAPE